MYTNYLSLITSLSSSTYFSDYLSVQDSNFEKIDTFASNIAGSVSTLGSNVTTLGSTVASLSSDLSSVVLEVTALSSAIANVNLSSALGISGSLTIPSTAWVGSACAVTLSNLGSYDAIFFKPYSVVDKSILDAANPFVVVSGSSISFTVQDTPSVDVTLGYYIDRGREVVKLATPSVTLSDNILYWPEVSGATMYDVYSNGSLLTSSSNNSVDLSTYLTEAGTYSITVVAKAIGYYDSDASTAVSYVVTPPASNQIYGVSGLYQSSPALTRTDDAVNMSAVVNSSTGLVSSDFDNAFPWNEATVETINGNKFLHLPDMWFRVGKDSSDRITDVAVSKAQGDSGSWYKVDSFYYGCYGGSLDANNKLASVSGVARQGSKKRSEFRTYARYNDPAFSYEHFQLDLYHKTVMLFLWYIEWANKDSQSIMRGRDATYGNTQVNCGGTDGLSTPSGFNTSTGQMRWHYIEDYIGNYFEFVDGCIGSDSAYYATADPSKFSDTGTGIMNMLAYSYPSNASSSNRCVSALGWDDNNPFLVQPKEQTGTDYTIHFCDSNPVSNDVVIYCGACYSYSNENNGVCYFNRNVTVYLGTNIGARLLYKPAS